MEVTGIACPLFESKCVTVNAPYFDKDLPEIAILLRSLSGLEKLTIKLKDGESRQLDFRTELENFNDMVEKYWMAYKTSFKPLLHLKTVEISGLRPNYKGCELVVEFVEFLLKNGGVLNHMIIDCSTEFVSEFSGKLLSMTRASPNAVIKFIQ